MIPIALVASLALGAAPLVPQDNVGSVTTPISSTGIIKVDIGTGRVDGRVCISNRPYNASKSFVLNAGLNVARVTDSSGKPIEFEGWYDPGIDGEARVYTSDSAPRVVCVEYVGALPVYPLRDAPDDFKGVLAFNGDSARFAEQAAWLPTAYDTKTKNRFTPTTYDLTVSCDKCKILYLNGDAPLEGSLGHFVSRTPRSPLLFVGTGPLTNTPNLTIINENVQIDQARILSNTIGKIGAFYGSYFGTAIKDKPVFFRMVTIDQLERDRRGSEWAFATWPTIAFSGSISKIASDIADGGKPSEDHISYIAHEMGHYYFGTRTNPIGPYRWFLLESTAEFMSLEVLRAISGQAAADRHMHSWATDFSRDKGSFLPLDQIHSETDIGEVYRYSYGPLLLWSLENKVGRKHMRDFMRALASDPNVQSWDDLRALAVKVGIDGTEWDAWRTEVVDRGKEVFADM